MEKIIFENEIYYFSKGIIYDDSFLEVPKNISQKVLISYYKNIDYKLFEETDLLEHLKQLKTSGFYNDCLTAIEYGLSKFTASYDFYKTVFPIITSCHRALGEPQKAVDFWMENYGKMYKELFKENAPSIMTGHQNASTSRDSASRSATTPLSHSSQTPRVHT